MSRSFSNPEYTPTHLDVPARDLGILLPSHNPLILCETVEEKRLEALVREVAGDLSLPVSTWSAASGLSPCHPAEADKTVDLGLALREIRACSGDGVWLLKDPQPYLENPAALRAVRETAQEFAGSARTLILVGPSMPRKPELDDLEVRFDLQLPSPEELRRLVSDTVRRLARDSPQTRVDLSREDLDGLVCDLQGLTMFEAERALARAVVEDRALTGSDRAGIRESKKDLVEGGGLLDFVAAPEGLDQIGGLERLKKWIGTRKVGFFPRPGEPALEPPKGILLLGVQGCGKSLAAKAAAASWELPLLALDAGRLLAPYIGESERNLRDALKRVERIAPCVLWIDEIEKAFVSVRSNESDGGVSKRLLGALLTWMQDRAEKIFLVATANSVEDLPPELIRKGRLDEIFFVDLPDLAARRDIFRLHLEKRAADPARFDLALLGDASRGFSGAEIEQVIVSALYESRAAGIGLDTASILVSLRSTRPLSVVRAEKIAALRAWAAERCVPASAGTID